MPHPPWGVTILGATGVVGQKLITLLVGHPWFHIAGLVASAGSAGRPYERAVSWLETTPLPSAIGRMPLHGPDRIPDAELVLSAVGAEAARDLEPELASRGTAVVSNASAFRGHSRVPILIPELNPDHLRLADRQPWSPGFIVTNPNCAVAGLVSALAPLYAELGLSEIQVTTLQAISGAGRPGHPAIDILGNVIPFIPGEEEKIETEPRKILGRPCEHGIREAPIRISSQANRVPVLDGHLLTVSARLADGAGVDDVRDAWRRVAPACDRLPTMPRRLLRLLDDPRHPQPRLHAGTERGMSVVVGRLRPCRVLSVRFVVLVHNTVRGAAGSTLLNAELLANEGRLGEPISTSGRANRPQATWTRP